MAKAIPVYRKDREKLLPCNTTIQQFQQDWRHSFVSRWVRRDQACEALDEQPRSGRPPKVEAAAKLPEGRTAGAMAAKLQQDHQPQLSVPPVCHMKQNGLQHLSPVVKPMLTQA